MSNLFDISISALQAFQTAISVTSNNIANANTPGYADETVNLSSVVPQAAANATIGDGVRVTSVDRAVNQLNNTQLNTSQSTLGQLNSLQTYTSQVDNIIGTTAGGLTTSLQNYYGAWSDVANNPTSTATRQALLSQANSVASAFQNTSSQLQGLNAGINAGITSDVAQINSLSSSIATLNQQIYNSTAQGAGAAPNDLLDQRDAALSSLSKLVGITTSTDSNGSLNVFVGNGQPLVLQGSVTQLITVPNQYNASQLEISTATNGSNNISSQVTAGDLGGLLAARAQAVNPALNQLGQIATALSASANTQQNAGLDLTGQIGANLFSIGSPQAVPSSYNTDTTTASVTVGTDSASLGALTADNYVLGYKAGAYSLTDATSGQAVAFSQSGNTLRAAGLTITLSATPASGDTFLVQPTANAAANFSVALTTPQQIAAAAALKSTATATNAGTGVLSGFTNPTAAALPAATTINFTSPTQYQINGTGTVYNLTAKGGIAFAGWQATLSGTPVTGDSFTVQSNAGATGDNTNALVNANQQTQGLLLGGTTSVNGATSAMVTNVGSLAQQVNTAQTAQTAVNSQALATVQSVSGVNLDEEAANLLKWQQAYQASAQALSIGNSIFNTLLTAVGSTSG